jgi:hypothetical protein
MSLTSRRLGDWGRLKRLAESKKALERCGFYACSLKGAVLPSIRKRETERVSGTQNDFCLQEALHEVTDLATRVSLHFNFLPKLQPELNLVEMVSALGSSFLDKETFEHTKSSLKNMMPLDACPTEIVPQFINTTGKKG